MGALGTIANFGAAVLALSLGGPYWGVIVFLAIALVRIALDAHILRRENELLEERVARLEGGFEQEGDIEAPPESGTRPSRPLLAKRAS